ncbi:phage tail tube protein [Cupriavidus taiwanensis]|uniref:phage tail tube protein n=1 Tax=Cupriavidus taiwanensis TaxID=164546 RepID=UPI000E2FE01F|nr:hypothetical protein [Cupriavidus taiwanensis]
MYLTDPDAAPALSLTISGATQAAPCLLTLADVTSLNNGDAVTVTDSAWPSLDGKAFVAQNFDGSAKTVELKDSDTSGETAPIAGTAKLERLAYVDVCVASYQINQNAAAEIDTTTLCDTEKTSLVGFTDPGTLTFDFFVDPTDANYLALIEAQEDKQERTFIIHYSNGAVRSMPVIVQQVNESGGVDQAIQGSATLKITGKSTLTQPTTLKAGASVPGPVSPSERVSPPPVTTTASPSFL